MIYTQRIEALQAEIDRLGGQQEEHRVDGWLGPLGLMISMSARRCSAGTGDGETTQFVPFCFFGSQPLRPDIATFVHQLQVG